MTTFVSLPRDTSRITTRAWPSGTSRDTVARCMEQTARRRGRQQGCGEVRPPPPLHGQPRRVACPPSRPVIAGGRQSRRPPPPGPDSMAMRTERRADLFGRRRRRRQAVPAVAVSADQGPHRRCDGRAERRVGARGQRVTPRAAMRPIGSSHSRDAGRERRSARSAPVERRTAESGHAVCSRLQALSDVDGLDRSSRVPPSRRSMTLHRQFVPVLGGQ